MQPRFNRKGMQTVNNYLKTIMAITKKEIFLEIRKKETISTMIIFSVLTIIIFSFSFNIEKADKKALIAGMLWIMIVFSSLLGLGTSFKKEQNNNTLGGLLMVPVDRSSIFYGKLLANMTFITFVELVSIPLFLILNNFTVTENLLLFSIFIFLGTLGFITIGTFLSAITSYSPSGELLLPVTLFPLSIPLLISSVKLTEMVINPGSESFSPWIQLVIVFDIVFLIIPLLIFEYIMEA